jgi:hypothetical protein
MAHDGKHAHGSRPPRGLAARLWLGMAVALLGLRPVSGQPLPLERITLPPGFEIRLYARGVEGARPTARSLSARAGRARSMPWWTGTGITRPTRCSRSPRG